MMLAASYFDGKSSQRHTVQVALRDGILVIDGAVRRQAGLATLRIGEPGAHAPRRIGFSDGACLEVADGAALAQMLRTAGWREPLSVRMRQSWAKSLLALLLLAMLMAGAYVYGLPVVANMLARAMPVRTERLIGIGTLQFLDTHLLAPTSLRATRQRALTARFAALRAPRAGTPAYTLLFRRSRIGPNAFALPSGQIVLTDQLIALAPDDDAIMGILAHELGHLHQRHMLRRLIQASVVSAGVAMLLGDVSAAITAVPAALLDMKYSRDAEREADDYALAMLRANHLSPARLAAVFERLNRLAPNAGGYLASHPSTAERIARLRSGGD
jgi:Zn-dependent protease with chaperone function